MQLFESPEILQVRCLGVVKRSTGQGKGARRWPTRTGPLSPLPYSTVSLTSPPFAGQVISLAAHGSGGLDTLLLNTSALMLLVMPTPAVIGHLIATARVFSEATDGSGGPSTCFKPRLCWGGTSG